MCSNCKTLEDELELKNRLILKLTQKLQDYHKHIVRHQQLDQFLANTLLASPAQSNTHKDCTKSRLKYPAQLQAARFIQPLMQNEKNLVQLLYEEKDNQRQLKKQNEMLKDTRRRLEQQVEEYVRMCKWDGAKIRSGILRG